MTQLTNVAAPRVSVVMSVYNGEQHLRGTIISVLQQTFEDFEFVIVDDGSTDSTSTILREFGDANSRIRIIRQQNQGLTRALNVGCSAARGEIIARQDVGDCSHPRRLQQQVDILDRNPEVVAVGCGARRIGPEGEFLGIQCRSLSPRETTDAFLRQEGALLHAASAFRKDAFLAAGGYREQFRFAQDTDLWCRLVERGMLAECDEVLFDVRIETAGISGHRIAQQVRLAGLAHECCEARRKNLDEQPILEQAIRISNEHAGESASPVDASRQEALAAYFIGSQLYAQRDARCRKYLRHALLCRSRSAASLLKYVMSFCTCIESEKPTAS